MSRSDEAGAAKAALAPLIAEMKQKPVGTAFEKTSDWLLKAGAAVTLAGMAIAFVVLKQDETSLWVRGTLILTIFGGCLVLTTGVALQALGSFLSLRRYNQVLCNNLEARFDQAKDLAKGLAARMPAAGHQPDVEAHPSGDTHRRTHDVQGHDGLGPGRRFRKPCRRPGVRAGLALDCGDDHPHGAWRGLGRYHRRGPDAQLHRSPDPG